MSHDEFCDERWVFATAAPSDFKVEAICNFVNVRLADYLAGDWAGGGPLDRHLMKFHPAIVFGNNEPTYMVPGLGTERPPHHARLLSVMRRDVEFDHPDSGRSFGFDLTNINRKDDLGRTALMRSAVRGYDHLVEELLAAGADPTVVDHRGRGILEQVRSGNLWIRTMIEEALR